MKSLSKICTAFFITLFISCPALYAQNIDVNRMNRDINIMESVLGEMFKTSIKTSGKKLHASNLSFGRSNEIRGTYLPDYGIMFTVPGMQRRFIAFNDENDDNYTYLFQYSNDSDDGNEVSKESIVLRIKEFLREYGSTLGQLKDDEKIMVVYNSQSQNNAVTFFNASGSGVKRLTHSLPTISVVVHKKDLKAYRSGKMSQSELDKRFSVSSVDDDAKDYLDLRVMANIFETALKDSEKERFLLSGNVDYLKLDNFGAVFSFKARYGSFTGILSAYSVRPLKIVRGAFPKSDKAGDVITADSIKVESIKEEHKKREQAEKKAYRDFLNNIKEYLIDYGRTLSSISSDQQVLIAATISSRVDEIPERVDFQLKKSVLEAMDKGSMSRDQALNQITVREY